MRLSWIYINISQIYTNLSLSCINLSWNYKILQLSFGFVSKML